jgi:hypothetical protein
VGRFREWGLVYKKEVLPAHRHILTILLYIKLLIPMSIITTYIVISYDRTASLGRIGLGGQTGGRRMKPEY